MLLLFLEYSPNGADIPCIGLHVVMKACPLIVNYLVPNQHLLVEEMKNQFVKEVIVIAVENLANNNVLSLSFSLFIWN